jgi:hypothetical protein
MAHHIQLSFMSKSKSPKDFSRSRARSSASDLQLRPATMSACYARALGAATYIELPLKTRRHIFRDALYDQSLLGMAGKVLLPAPRDQCVAQQL